MNMESVSACPACAGDSLSVADPVAGVSRCGGCGFLFNNPRPAPDELAEFYSAEGKYGEWVLCESARDAMWERRIRRMLPFATDGSLLDVGAGTGQFLAHARPHFSRVCGTEVSASAVVIAREKYGIDLLRGRVEEMPGTIGLFDTITLFHVLEHVHDPQAVLRACRALLTARGMLFVAVPNDIHGIRRRGRGLLKFALGRLGVRRFAQYGVSGDPAIRLDGSQQEIHLGHFTPRTLRSLLLRCGFDVVHTGGDPFYAAQGIGCALETAYFTMHRMITALTGVNAYDAMLFVVRKGS